MTVFLSWDILLITLNKSVMAKKSVKKKITLDDLAKMVAEGFNEATEGRRNIRNELKDGLESVRSEFRGDIADVKNELKGDLAIIRSQMVTKSYLDDKLADLEGGVVTRQRKEDHKVNLLIEFLKKKKILGKSELKMLREIQVFPYYSSRKT